MATKTCPDCRKDDIDEGASVCPYCRHEFGEGPRFRRRQQLITLVVIVAILVVAYVALVKQPNDAKRSGTCSVDSALNVHNPDC